MAEVKGIFNDPSRREAIRRFKTWKEKCQVEAERAVRCMEKDLFHCLHYYAFSKELWKKVRTTNMLERDFREVRRRNRPMGFFPHEESAKRIFYGVTNGIHQNGRHPPSYNFSRDVNMTFKQLPVESRFAWFDCRLPTDIIDKPIGMRPLLDNMNSGKLLGQTLLFALLLGTTGPQLYARYKILRILCRCLDCVSHICLDEMWLKPISLILPLCGCRFEKIDLPHWQNCVLVSLGTEPGVYILEIIGSLLLFVFLSRLLCLLTLSCLLTKGDAA